MQNRIGLAVLLAILSGFIAGSAQAQNSLGEAIDAGAKIVSKEDLMALLPGASASGMTGSGVSYRFDYQADASLSGSFRWTDGRTYGLTGKWSVNDKGQLCADYVSHPGNQRSTSCYFHFKLRDQYFLTESDSDRSVRLIKRDIAKK